MGVALRRHGGQDLVLPALVAACLARKVFLQGAAIRAINSMEVALLGLLLLVGGTWVPQAAGLRILVVHPLYAGSHVLTLQSVTAELLKHGHSVATVKFQDTNCGPCIYALLSKADGQHHCTDESELTEFLQLSGKP